MSDNVCPYIAKQQQQQQQQQQQHHVNVGET
jgi:hypothetical protein